MKKSKVFFYAFTAAFGALVVGLNMGGISGAIDLIEAEFSLSALAKGFVTGALMVGCLFGALLGGRLSDRYGRKPMLMISAILLAVSAAGSAFLSASAAPLVIFRLIGGLGVGVLSAVIPTYITEISPAELRGTFVSFYQLFVVVGILVAYCANYLLVGTAMNWHLMLGLPLVFAIIDILLLLALPESPLWLAERGKSETKEEKVAFGELFKGRMGYVVFLGSMLAFFQQITGINVVVNYAPSILAKLGIAGSNPLLQTVFIGLANLIFTVIALWLVDKFGRKTLLVCGCFGCTASLAYLTYAYSVADPSSIGVLAAEGADEYIRKPFNINYVKVKIIRILEERRQLKEAFVRKFNTDKILDVSVKDIPCADDVFRDNLMDFIENNYENSELSIDDISSALGLSRVQLYRKTKSNFDLSPIDLLRKYRLRKAALLLKDSNLSVSEIAYMTGFSSPAYFTRCFKELFGVPPTSYVSEK